MRQVESGALQDGGTTYGTEQLKCGSAIRGPATYPIQQYYYLTFGSVGTSKNDIGYY